MARVPSWIAMEEYADVTPPVLDQMGEVLEISRDEGDVEKLMDEGDALQTDMENVSALKDAVVNADEISEPAEEIATVAAESFCSRWGISVKQQIAMESYKSGDRRRGLLVALEAAEESIWQTIKRWFRELIEKIKKFFSGLFGKNATNKKEIAKAKKNVEETTKANAVPKKIAFKPQPVYKAAEKPKTEEQIMLLVDKTEKEAAQDTSGVPIDFDNLIRSAVNAINEYPDMITALMLAFGSPIVFVKKGIKSLDNYLAAMGDYRLCMDAMGKEVMDCADPDVHAWIKGMESSHSGDAKYDALEGFFVATFFSQKDEMSPVAFDVYMAKPPKFIVGDSTQHSPEEVYKLAVSTCDTLAEAIKKTESEMAGVQKDIDNIDIASVRNDIAAWAGSDTDKFVSGISVALKQHSSNIASATRLIVGSLSMVQSALNGYLATIA